MNTQERDEKEAEVDVLVKQKDTDAACRLLVALVTEYAKEKNFKKAEELYNRLYEVDSMALTEIVRAGEIIEEEKSESVDREHLEIWSDLYGTLSTTEANALYYSMKTKIFEAGEPIMEQGTFNSRLYFINKGEVKALYLQGDREILITMLMPGQILGQMPFFTASVCTLSMVPMNRVKTSFLETDVLKKWKNDVPALESRLYDYCMHNDPVKKALDEKNIERRTDRREKFFGRIKFVLLDKSGKSLGNAYSGEIADISVGGMSFIVKSPKKESIRMLLGRRLRVIFDLPLKSHQKLHRIDQAMTVIAAQPQAFDDYSVHLKFDIKWVQKMMDAIDFSENL
jgi:CRP-like cAMP-binding protein